MTDLTAKFATITDQLTAQHTELMALLNSIAEALGAPPVGPVTTLDDVVAALTQSNVNTAGIRSDMADQQALLLTAAQGIFNNSELMLENNSVNTQNLLSAILSNDPCKDCAASPSFPPPLDVTPQELNAVHCQRMQALLYALLRFSTKIDVVSSFGTGFSLTVIQDAFNEVLTELSNPSGLVIPSFVELTSLVAAVVSYIVSNVFDSNSIPFALQSINDTLLAALYATDNSNDGLAAYANVINSSSIDDSIKLVLIRIGYADLFNFYFDPANTIDLTGYDGSLCNPDDSELVMVVPTEGCRSAQSVLATMGDDTTLQSIDWSPGSTENMVNESLTQTSDKRVWGLDDLYHLWVSSVPDCHAYLDATGFPNIGITSTPQQITVHTNNRYSFVTASTEFVLTICVDEP